MSQLKINSIANVAGSASTDVLNVINGSAKAWVNFNGTGTVAIRQGYNVSSITDNGAGDYTVNFTNALADANYAISGSAGYTGFVCEQTNAPVKTASAIKIFTPQTTNGSPTDYTVCSVSIFR